MTKACLAGHSPTSSLRLPTILRYTQSPPAVLVVPLLGVASLFLLTRDRQIPSRAPDMAIRHEQSGRGKTLQSNNTSQGDYPGVIRWLCTIAGHIISAILSRVRAGCAKRRGRRWGDSETRKPRKGTKAAKLPLSCPSLPFASFVFQTPLHHPNLLFHQPIQLVHQSINLPVRGLERSTSSRQVCR
jgi:hypothetical protein